MSHTVTPSELSITFRNILDCRTHSETSETVNQTLKYADDLLHLQTSLSYHPHPIMLSMTNLPIEPSELSIIYIANVQLHYTEAVAQRFSMKKVFLEILQNSQENTCVSLIFH